MKRLYGFLLSRSPALTLLHISASKFSDTPLAGGGIAGFLSSDVTSSQALFPASVSQGGLESSGLRIRSGGGGGTPSKPGMIQSLFQRAAEKQRQRTEEEEGKDQDGHEEGSVVELPPGASRAVAFSGDQSVTVAPVPTSSTSTTTTPSSAHTSPSKSSDGGISSFFQRKSLERRSQAAATSSEADGGQRVATGPIEAVGAVVSALQSEQNSQPPARPSACQESSAEPGADDVPLPSHGDPGAGPDVEDLVACEHCGRRVPAWDMPEHSDYHFALDLQRSFTSPPATAGSSLSAASPPPVRTGASATNQATRGKSKSKGQSGPQSKRPRPQGGPLDSFFKKN